MAWGWFQDDSRALCLLCTLFLLLYQLHIRLLSIRSQRLGTLDLEAECVPQPQRGNYFILHFYSYPSPCPWQPLNYFPAVCIFWDHSICGVMQYIFFRDSLFSLSLRPLSSNQAVVYQKFVPCHCWEGFHCVETRVCTTISSSEGHSGCSQPLCYK